MPLQAGVLTVALASIDEAIGADSYPIAGDFLPT
jgi:hypothetical protein